MNPFKHKQLDEFTIADCEQYISDYPYGERISDVKKHLYKLKVGVKDILVQTEKVAQEHIETNASTDKLTEQKKEKVKQRIDDSNTDILSQQTNDSNSAFKTIITWVIGIIVAIVVAIILIEIVKALFPSLSNSTVRWISFGIFVLVGNCLKEILD